MSDTHASSPLKARWFLAFFAGFLLVMAADHLIVSHYLSRKPWAQYRSQNSAFENIAVAETYAYSHANYPVVLVGASTTSMMPPQTHPIPGLFTLPQQGGSAMTGIETVLRSGAAPKALLVQVDFNDRHINQALIDDLFHPLSYTVRRHVPGLRYAYNVSTLLSKRMLHPNSEIDPDPAMPIARWHAQLLPSIESKIAEVSKERCLPDAERDQILATLRQQVDRVRQRGTQVVLYTDPFDQDINAARCTQNWHRAMQAMFPDLRIIHPPALQKMTFYTHDGFHMYEQSGVRYVRYLLEESGASHYLPDAHNE